jgi:RNA polymerase-binding transcription factor DksA
MKSKKKNSRNATRRPTKAVSRTTNAVLATGGTASAMARDIDPKWRWHYQTLLELRDRLRTQRGAKIGAAAESLEPHSMDQADTGTDEFDHDLALSQLSASQNALYEVEAALNRIANGTYGVCEMTGRPIAAARLKAIPWARFTREVEARLESERAVQARQLGRLGSVKQLTGDLEESEVEEEPPSPPADDESLYRQRTFAVKPRRHAIGRAHKHTARR